MGFEGFLEPSVYVGVGHLLEHSWGVKFSVGGKSFKVGVESSEHLFSKYCQRLSQNIFYIIKIIE